MTKTEYIDILNNSTRLAQNNSLHCAVIFLFSPVSKMIETRLIYSPERFECVDWLNKVANYYDDMDIDYKAYLDRNLERDNGDIFQYIEGWC